MLAFWNPFVPVKRQEYKDIFKSLDSYYDNFFQSTGISQVKNEDGSFSIDVDMPGIKESEINIQLMEDNIVTIEGSRKTKTSSYTVNKSFVLPDKCDPDSLKAELKDGVLTLTLADKKLPEVKEPKKIPITTK